MTLLGTESTKLLILKWCCCTSIRTKGFVKMIAVQPDPTCLEKHLTKKKKKKEDTNKIFNRIMFFNYPERSTINLVA